MCGIVAYLGAAEAKDILVAGLQRLEYRGYDSAGVAIMQTGGEAKHDSKRQRSAAASKSGEAAIKVVKQAGKVANLKKACDSTDTTGSIGIAHTRWATHGPPTNRNSHPHCSVDGKIAVVHNGIVENFAALKTKLEGLGYKMASDTDTELIAHLIYDVRKQSTLLIMAPAQRRAPGGLTFGPSRPRAPWAASGERPRRSPPLRRRPRRMPPLQLSPCT